MLQTIAVTNLFYREKSVKNGVVKGKLRNLNVLLSCLGRSYKDETNVALKVFLRCPNVKSKRCIDPTDNNGY